MPNLKRSLASAAVAASAVVLALGLSGSPAFAAVDPGTPGYLTFWQGGFTGPTLEYSPSQVDTSCVTLPFSVQADLNYSYRTALVYDGTGCTGSTLTLPAGDLHSFGGFVGKSFRFAS
ncbi:hypothetical protein Shyhy01_20830 [Streptomyces hygroscopicus subsp. hygroscopicus]|uniref:hypothetical protein n=1 Tax=Streptomyces sp. KHY 26 TaxID=3097359 RepID=UPI0024A51457|nr:hypothetical protein [Streptomyces hygroscopicus]GLX49133.1 hypothetical protein Shyhy01_20830 [Streptomyces hygroscopicus subsp. hygroscopicus]